MPEVDGSKCFRKIKTNGYPTINNYLSQLEVDNLPSEFQGGFVRNGGVIYASTRLFPSSGVISCEYTTGTSFTEDIFIDTVDTLLFIVPSLTT